MFNIITNVRNREVISSISLDELVETIKNPSVIHKKIVDKARNIDKKSTLYKKIKESLPCFVPNYTHCEYVKTDTIIKSTGFLYIDIDYNIEIEYSKHPFIVASWKSLSNIGTGLIVSIKDIENMGSDLQTMRYLVNTVSNILDVKPDSCAISRDRLNVIGYDNDIFYNKDYKDLEVIINNISIDLTNDKVINKDRININNRLEVDDNFISENIRFDNLSDYTKEYTFEDDEVFKDLGNKTIDYVSIYIPKTIPEGNRNKKLYNILSSVKAINPKIEEQRLLGFAKYLNNNVCYEPLGIEEIKSLTIRIMKSEIKPFANKTKRFLFNEDYMLNGKEKQGIATTERNRVLGEQNTTEILEKIKYWDYDKYSKITYKSISQITGFSYPTIIRKKEIIKEFIKNNHNIFLK